MQVDKTRAKAHDQLVGPRGRLQIRDLVRLAPLCRGADVPPVSRKACPEELDRYAPNRHDTGSTKARSVDEVALIPDTTNHYGPVFIAPLSIQIRRAGVQKKFGLSFGSTRRRQACPRLSNSHGYQATR
jgi:hypothetical protein